MPGRGIDTRRRLDALQARKGLTKILRASGAISFSRHARQEMEADDLTEPDFVNTLRCGNVSDGDLVNGTWRYRVETDRIMVVVAFQGEREIVVVTTWRVRARGQ